MHTWTAHNHSEKNYPIKKTVYTYVRLKDVFRLLFTKVNAGGGDISPLIYKFFTEKLILFLYIQTITLEKTLRQYEILHARFNILHFQNFKYPF